MLLKYLLQWAPFKIDALGLISLFGEGEINRAIGTLSPNPIAEFLPLVGGHVIANDSMRQPIVGFTLYNISDGICASDVAPWFARWLQSQDLTYNATTLTIDFISPFSRRRRFSLWTVGFGIIVYIILIGFSLAMRDWWGVTNAIALAVEAVLRSAILWALRESVDSSAILSLNQSQELVKTLWTLPDGSSVILYTLRGLITECLLSDPKPRHRKCYAACKIASWAFFITHVVSIGMAALPTQVLTVTIMAASSVCCIMGCTIDSQLIGTKLRARRFDLGGRSQSMAGMFSRLRLTAAEEKCMVSWRLMPSRTNVIWWSKYRKSLAKGKPEAFENWKEKGSWAEGDSLLRGIERRLSNEEHEGEDTDH
jgi:hypothetical protein